MKKNYIYFVLFILLAAACQSTNNEKTANASPASEPASLPSSSETASSSIPIYDYAGLAPIFEYKTDTTYVINFWATWCKPCVEELPYFVSLHDKYKDQKFKLIFVSLDFPKQIEKKLIPFLQKNQLPGEMMVLDDPDSNTWINAIDPEWSGAIPATIVYNANKREFHEQSFDDFEQLDAIVKKFIP